jgi:DNA-binding CsgD family transcriptional regulator
MALDLDAISRILETSNVEQLHAAMERSVQAMGFSSFMIGLEIRRPPLPALSHVCSGYPVPWQKIYVEREYAAVDPTVSHCQRVTTPLDWSESLYRNQKERELWEEARGYGIEHGMSLSIHGGGGVKSMISLARDQAVADPRELAMMKRTAQVLVNCAHTAAERILLPVMLTDVSRLTKRERQCLKWAAEGLTAASIGMKLGISEPTAIHHLNNMVHKLKASNRIHAVAIGVTMGLVD